MTKSKKNLFNLILTCLLAFVLTFMTVGCKNTQKDEDTTEPDTPIVNPGDDVDPNPNPNPDPNPDPSPDPNPDPNPDPEPTQNVVNIVGFGDSISAGYAISGSDMYESYVSYANGETAVNDMCYTNLIAQKYAESYETVNVKNYAVSGHKTYDMIDIIDNVSENYPNVSTDIENADVITVCIGANNVLGALLDGGTNSLIASYVFSTMLMPTPVTDVNDASLDDIRNALETGLAKFKDDYTNKILPKLTTGNAKVYVMTIYDPFKYFDANEITITGNYASMLTNLPTNFNTAKELAISYLNQLNEYIRENSDFENVVVVDVNASFEAIETAEEYRLYINADSSKITIDSNDITNVSALQSNPYFDPHPTSVGQRYIANIFLTAMEQETIPLVVND